MQPSPSTEAVKARLKQTWMSGDFGVIARGTEAAAEAFIARCAPRPGMAVLDVACGTGNLAIPAARAGATVLGVDIAPNLLEQARARAAQEGLAIRFEEGDAEALAQEDGSFDLVVTMFGAMFAPRPAVAAQEMGRVCRRGGTIAMANWTPGGFLGELFRVIARHVPPPPDLPSPLLWGDEATVRERLGAVASEIRLTRRLARIAFALGVPETVQLYRQYYGPTLRAFAGLPAAGQAALQRDLEALYAARNRATDGSTAIEAEYLEVVAIRR